MTFVRRVALAGDADRARVRIEAVVGAGADSVNVFPLGAGRMDTVRAFAACVLAGAPDGTSERDRDSLDVGVSRTGRHHGRPRGGRGVHHTRSRTPRRRSRRALATSRVPHEEPGPGFVERMFPVGNAYVQTLEATGDGVVQRFLDRRGPGLHHVAFEVDRIDAALESLRAVGSPRRRGAAGRRDGHAHRLRAPVGVRGDAGRARRAPGRGAVGMIVHRTDRDRSG